MSPGSGVFFGFKKKVCSKKNTKNGQFFFFFCFILFFKKKKLRRPSFGVVFCLKSLVCLGLCFQW